MDELSLDGFDEYLKLRDRFMFRAQAEFSKKTKRDYEILSFTPRRRKDPNHSFWKFWDVNYGYQWPMRDIRSGQCYWVGLIEDALVADSIDSID